MFPPLIFLRGKGRGGREEVRKCKGLNMPAGEFLKQQACQSVPPKCAVENAKSKKQKQWCVCHVSLSPSLNKEEGRQR